MVFHIGKKIKEIVFDVKHWSIAEFAKSASVSYRTAQYLFERDDVSIKQLEHISKVLDYDFFQHYGTERNNMSTTQSDVEVNQRKKKDYVTMMFSLQIGGEQALYEHFPDLIKKTRQIADELGFEIM
jgi:hypothetical protein